MKKKAKKKYPPPVEAYEITYTRLKSNKSLKEWDDIVQKASKYFHRLYRKKKSV